MIRFLKGLVLLPVAVIIVLLAVANHQPVVLSFDPISPQPIFSLALPLYALVFGAVALGIVVGGVGAWLGQGKSRRSARHHRIERERLEREVAQQKTFPSAPAASGAYAGATLPATR